MNTGTYISGAGHLALIAWVLLAELFSAPAPRPMEVTDVTILSGEEFAALSAPAAGPTQDVTPPETPALPRSPRPAPTPERRPEPPAPPAPQEPATPDAAPDTSGIEPTPPAEVADTAPILTPPPLSEVPEAPVPDTAPPRPSPRIAPDPAAPPPDEVAIADLPSQATRPDPAAATPVPEADDAAPEEATTQTVTEADERPETGLALAASPRPRARPAAPARPTAPAAPTAPAEDAIADAVADAVAAAIAGGEAAQAGAGTAPTGPPLTAGERDALRVSVSRCWNVGSLSSEALATTVIVGLEMQEDGRPVAGTIRLMSWSGGSEAAARQTFESARRAIIRCGAPGFPLPVEKYAQWRDIEMTFNPEKMRIR
ncbi:MAG: energy transducer TonB [Rhodobacteraceae bacterium]|nr:energy transducer TonB [Paracoccaceae bacterium]